LSSGDRSRQRSALARACSAGADRKTGLPIDETLYQQVTVGVAVAGQRVDVMPVLDVSAAVTPDSINSTAKLADTANGEARQFRR
jgi:hypothetical protein